MKSAWVEREAKDAVDRYGAAGMMQTFIAERRYFQPGIYPRVSTTGSGLDVGHYTQIIWRTTRAVGCAAATGDRAASLGV